MIAAKRFRDRIEHAIPDCASLQVVLYGSLASIANGYGADRAICLGLVGEEPHQVDPASIAQRLNQLARDRSINLADGRSIVFDPANAIILEKKRLRSSHPNAMRFRALSVNGELIKEAIFFSIGSGFLLVDGERPAIAEACVPYPFRCASDFLRDTSVTGLSIADLQLANERTWRSDTEIRKGLDAIRKAMFDCIDRGLSHEGELPGGLKVKRRAKGIHDKLLARSPFRCASPRERLEWTRAYAFAVGEENAAGGRVVAAPTNGAAGIVPAVLRHYREFCTTYSDEGARTFLLTAAAIGGLIKAGASTSSVRIGCQGEIGSAAAMAAAGLAAVSGGKPDHIKNAAEIALEHHLGMTCDPEGGLVQLPCIERNANGARKAIVAATLALRGASSHRATLDGLIGDARKLGQEMQGQYKQTSRDELSANVAEC